MELKLAIYKAEQILNEERLRPTCMYVDKGVNWAAEMQRLVAQLRRSAEAGSTCCRGRRIAAAKHHGNESAEPADGVRNTGAIRVHGRELRLTVFF
jgi:hypothetical protein